MTWQGTGTPTTAALSEDATQLCTLAQAKRALGLADSDTDHDSVLIQIIQQVSAQLEGPGGSNRRLTQHTLDYRYWDVTDRQTVELLCPSWPIVSVEDIEETTDNDWANADELVEGEDYYLDEDRGRLIRIGYWLFGRRSVRATDLEMGYVSPVTSSAAGFAIGDGEVLMPQDIVGAAVAQAIHAFNKRLDPSNVGGGAGGANVYGPAMLAAHDLLPGVAAVMRRYRRIV